MLRPQETSSAPEGEYLAAAGAVTRRQASDEPAYQVVNVGGRPYHLPVLAAPLHGHGKGQGRPNKAHELDLHRTSATVLAEMHDPDAVECVREAPSASAGVSAARGQGCGGKTK